MLSVLFFKQKSLSLGADERGGFLVLIKTKPNPYYIMRHPLAHLPYVDVSVAS